MGGLIDRLYCQPLGIFISIPISNPIFRSLTIPNSKFDRFCLKNSVIYLISDSSVSPLSLGSLSIDIVVYSFNGGRIITVHSFELYFAHSIYFTLN